MRMLFLFAAIAAGLGLIVSAASAAGAEKLDRNLRPTPGPSSNVRTPKLDRATLTNGLPVWVVERHELPIVNAVLQFQAGAAQDGAVPGIAAVTAALLDEGTAKRSALEFNEAVGFLGASLTSNAGTEVSQASLQTLSKHLDPALDLLGEMVSQPAFRAEELERERKSRLQSLKQQKDVATAVADRIFNLVTYGEDHPYGHPAGGTPASIEALTREQVASFYQRHYRPDRGVLVVVGDVTLATLVPKLERAFAGWTPAAAAANVVVPSRPAARPTAVYLVDKPNAAQSEIRIGMPGTTRANPDYYALQILNTALGGQFTSRVNLNLREKHGFTYGARSAWGFRRGDGPFVASAGVFTAKTDSALVELLRELKDIRGPRPLSDQEVEFARNALTRGYPRRFETLEATANVLSDLALYNLPDSEIGNFLTQIARVTPADVTRVGAKYLSPENLAIVVVGDLAKVRAGIEALHLGPVSVLDADGKPVAAQ